MAVIQLFGREAARAGELGALSERYRRAQFRRMGFDSSALRRRRGGRRDRRGRPPLVGRDRDPRRHAHVRRPRGLHAVHPALLPADPRRVGEVLGHAGGHGRRPSGCSRCWTRRPRRGHGGPGRRGRAARRPPADEHTGRRHAGTSRASRRRRPSSSGTSGSPIRGPGRAGRRATTRDGGAAPAWALRGRVPSHRDRRARSRSSAAPGRGRRRSPGSSRGRTTSQRGAVLVEGVDVREWDLAALRRHVGLVLQDVVLFAGTVAENLALGRDLPRAMIEDVARRVHADAFIRDARRRLRGPAARARRESLARTAPAPFGRSGALV